MPRLQITTPYGNRYIIHANGDIERTDLEGFKPSGQWRMLGMQHVRRRAFIPLQGILTALPHIQLLYKNGNPQWTVRDLDHGTIREWGNTQYHGIKSIAVLD